MSCLFCAIASGEIPSRRVFQDENAVAFLDINPWHPGHSLVIPRRHAADLLDRSVALAEITPAIEATAALLVEKLGADGLNLLSSAGEVAGQEVFHLHVHLVPRYASRPGLRELFTRETDIDLDAVHQALIS